MIAHRGASAEAPENTLPAFERALALGATHLELDVRLSRDGVLVAFHDETLDEKTDRSGRVNDFTAEELRRTDIGTWFDAAHGGDRPYAGTTLVTLDEVFEAFGRRPYYHVEMKGRQEEIPARVVERIAAATLADRVTVTSFQPAQLRRVQELDAGLPLCLLVKASRPEQIEAYGGSLEAIVDGAGAEGFAQVGLRSRDLTPALVRRAEARSLAVRAWKIRNRDDMEHAIAAGATGMTIDRPEWLLPRVAPAKSPKPDGAR